MNGWVGVEAIMHTVPNQAGLQATHEHAPAVHLLIFVAVCLVTEGCESAVRILELARYNGCEVAGARSPMPAALAAI